MAEKMKVRASLIEMWRRVIDVVKDDNQHVYWNGEDNLYPQEVRSVIANSPTAFRASSLMSKFVGGSGVLNTDGVKMKYSDLPFVNKRKHLKITDIISMASKDIADEYGVWFHVGYGINEDGKIAPVSLDVLEYEKCRKGKDDDNGNLGKIFFKDFNTKTKFGGKKEKARWFYPFSSEQSVITSQIKADSEGSDDLESAIKKYRGQVYYLNLTPQFKYALSRADSVYNDCDTEYRMGLYRNTQTREGFIGKTVVVTQGLDEETAKTVKEDLSKWLGSENSGSLYHLDVDSAEDITKVIYINQLKPQFDDKLFVETDKVVRRNILGAFNNIPEVLVSVSDNALFGTSGEMYREAKLFYCEQVEEEQEKLQETLSLLGFPTKIEPIVKRITPTENV